MQNFQKNEYFYKFWKCLVIKLIFKMLEAIFICFISITLLQYCCVMNAMTGKQKLATLPTVSTPEVTQSKKPCYSQSL